MTRSQSVVSRLAKAAIVLSMLFVSPNPGMCDLPLTHYRGSRIVSGWLPSWTDRDGTGAGWESVENNYDLLDDVSFFAWDADPQTGALAPPGKGMSDETIEGQVTWLQTRDVTALFTVTLFNKVSEFLGNADAQSALIDNIVETSERYGFSGVDIDFEQFGRSLPGDAERYAGFLDRLAKRMRREKDLDGFPKMVIATIIAHTSPERSGYTDEQVIADTAVDRIRVMAYDDYDRGSKIAGACAPLPWTRKVTEYIDGLNAPHGKFELGIPTYAYRWPVKSSSSRETTGIGLPVTYSQAQALMKTHGAARVWDEESQTPGFKYAEQPSGQNWRAYYEDAQSCDAKIVNVLLPSDLGGICEWALGFEDPASWSVVSQTLSTPYPVYGAIGQYYARFGAGTRFGEPLGPAQPFGAVNESLPLDHEGIRQRFEKGTIEYKWGDWHASFTENPEKQADIASTSDAEDDG